MARINVANPSGRSMLSNCWGHDWNTYLFSFGAYGDTHVLAYGSGLEDALEEAASWLADNAPGLIMAHDSAELAELYLEACRELYGVELPWDHHGCDMDDRRARAQEEATVDQTYTEAGYIASWEWSVWENPTKEDLIRIAHER